MARPAGVPTRQLGARVPCDLFEAAVRLGEKQGLDISSTIIQALQEWVDAQEEKYCPVCSTVNPPAARYCMECASPLTPEGVEEFQKIEEFLKNNPSAKHLLKKMSETTVRDE